MSRLTVNRKFVAWALGLTGALACATTGCLTVAIGLSEQPVVTLIGSLFGVLMGVLGALIAIREPRNCVGWLMCSSSLALCLITLPAVYGYTALMLHHGAWPLGSAAIWVGTWSSIPAFGLLLPLVLVRFPNGSARPRWQAVEWMAAAGTVVFTLTVALTPDAYPPFVSRRALALLAPQGHSPLGSVLPANVLADAWIWGLSAILLTYLLASASLLARYRRAASDERAQLKWIAYAGAVIAPTAVYAGGAWYHGASLPDALVPLGLALTAIPIAIGIAILRYRLYDIELIINRTLVYAGLTAILGALYAATNTLVSRLFISVSGQTSNAAYVITAFVVVASFGPLKDWLQGHVNRRLGGARSGAALDKFRAGVETVVAVLDGERLARQLVDEAAAAFDVRGAALYLAPERDAGPAYRLGHLNGDVQIEVEVKGGGRRFGRVVLGTRHGDLEYSRRDREALRKSAAAVGEALALGARFAQPPQARVPTHKGA